MFKITEVQLEKGDFKLKAGTVFQNASCVEMQIFPLDTFILASLCAI